MEHRIRELIKEKGYTQEEFAKMVGTTRVGLSKNLVCPSGTTLEKIAEALEVDMWELFKSKDEITKEVIEERNNTIPCPHCGKPIDVTLLKPESAD